MEEKLIDTQEELEGSNKNGLKNLEETLENISPINILEETNNIINEANKKTYESIEILDYKKKKN